MSTRIRANWLTVPLGLVWLLIMVTSSTASDQTVDVRAGVGHDTNVFETGDVPGQQQIDALYSSVRLTLRPPKFGKEERFEFRPKGLFVWYPDASSGNRLGASARLRFKESWKSGKSTKFRRRTTLTIDGYGAYERALFLRRSIREDIGIGDVVPDLSLGELPARSELGAGFELRSRTTKRLTLISDVFARIRSYTNSSNPDVAEYSRLDDRQLSIRGGVEINLPRKWKIVLDGMFRNRFNPRRSARTVGGTEVPDVDRHFHYWDGEMEVSLKEGRVRNGIEISYRHRSDRFEGYYSYDQVELGDRLSVEAGRAIDVELTLLLGRRQYDVYAPGGLPLENDYTSLALEVRNKLTKRFHFFVRPVYEINDSNDPVLDYDRFKVVVEIRGVR